MEWGFGVVARVPNSTDARNKRFSVTRDITAACHDLYHLTYTTAHKPLPQTSSFLARLRIQKMPAEFLDLPLDLLAVIFRHVPGPHDLTVLARVNKAFHSFALPFLYAEITVYQRHNEWKNKVRSRNQLGPRERVDVSKTKFKTDPQIV